MIDTWPAIRPETSQLRTEAVIEYLPIRLSTGHPNGPVTSGDQNILVPSVYRCA